MVECSRDISVSVNTSILSGFYQLENSDLFEGYLCLWVDVNRVYFRLDLLLSALGLNSGDDFSVTDIGGFGYVWEGDLYSYLERMMFMNIGLESDYLVRFSCFIVESMLELRGLSV